MPLIPAQVLARPGSHGGQKWGIRVPDTGVTDDRELLRTVGAESNPVPLEGQSVLLTAEPSPQHPSPHSFLKQSTLSRKGHRMETGLPTV